MLIDNYNTQTLQVFLSLLNQAEAKGLADIRFVRERIEDAIRKKRLKVGRVRKAKHPKRIKDVRCPSCGQGTLVGPYVLDGVQIVRCSLKCGYSEIVK